MLGSPYDAELFRAVPKSNSQNYPIGTDSTCAGMPLQLELSDYDAEHLFGGQRIDGRGRWIGLFGQRLFDPRHSLHLIKVTVGQSARHGGDSFTLPSGPTMRD